ncbi:MAG: glyceraldehyde 3-phosphate dehydrogenase NAD-binding domain-containing protein [Candidatus Doudnabacteria bacterium]|nr:glyceraldehyde 3-phosphate dehydrogenase NAD-binding domain-containing protein [Candidatus Doudnabacteria bacterium]
MPKASSKPKTRIALNGLGRIGRVFLRIASNNPNFEIVAAHSRGDVETYAHLLKYDSTYGTWDKSVDVKNGHLVANGVKIPYYRAEGDALPWKKIGVDFVLDATGRFTKRNEAEKHLAAGAKYVMASAPMSDADETFVFGANEKKFEPQTHRIISGGSCTTVCSTLTMKVLEETFGVNQAFINTVHAVTGDQSLLDASHKDLRRARSAMESIIPTTTGVSKTIVKIYPHLEGKISGLSLRVPVLNPSLVVLTAELKKPATKEYFNKAFSKAATGELKGLLAVNNLPLVSTDFRANPHGAIVDLFSSEIVNGRLANVLAWYDNEWGYVQQMVYLLEYLCKRISQADKK